MRFFLAMWSCLTYRSSSSRVPTGGYLVTHLENGTRTTYRIGG